MRYKILTCISVLFTLLFVGCDSDEESQNVGLGRMIFSVSIDGSDALSNGSLPSVNDFTLFVSTVDGKYSHSWEKLIQFPEYESFYEGEYYATVSYGDLTAEGIGEYSYFGEAHFSVKENHTTRVEINCKIKQSKFNVEFDPSVTESFSDVSLTMHSEGYNYVKVTPGEGNNVFLMPGKTTFYLTLSNSDGREVSIAPEYVINTASASVNKVDISFLNENIVFNVNGEGVKLPITDKLFSSTIPVIANNGFYSGIPIDIIEGYPYEMPVEMDVFADVGLSSLTLTIIGLSDDFGDLPKECELLGSNTNLESLGLEIEKVEDGFVMVKYTKLLENLSVLSNVEVKFILQAKDILGRVSEPSVLSVNIKSVNFEIASVTPAYVGTNETTITIVANSNRVESSDFCAFILDPITGEPIRQADIVDVDVDLDSPLAAITIDVGEGIDPVSIRIDYMGNEKVNLIVPRSVPSYKISVDPFAVSALLIIEGDSEEETAAITQYAKIFANGKETPVLHRDPSKGQIRITGLEPSTNYTIKPVIIAGSFVPEIKLRTEVDAQVPEGDFEMAVRDFEYFDMPKGGVYSTTKFPLFNMQNYANVSVYWIEKFWANVNEKTFNLSAKNHNTWYLQPSSQIDFDNYASGSKSMRITSVGWSLNGDEIQPYQQAEGQYLPYNNNVPHVDHHSAGKLFLGSYKFNPKDGTEKYVEGVRFGSRPSSLNGYFKYAPDSSSPNDVGFVKVELINDAGEAPVVIAEASMSLGTSPDFITFHLPIEYNIIGIKATKLKILFSSSMSYGSIEEEDANVPVSADIPEAKYTGSTLWIDNLTFSY